MIASVIDLHPSIDARTLLLGGYLSAHPAMGQDLTEEMLDVMEAELASARAELEANGVVSLGSSKVHRAGRFIIQTPNI